MTSDAGDRPAPSPRARGARLWSRLWPFLLFAVLVFLFAPRALLGQAVLGPVDMLEPMTPYRETIDRPPSVVSPAQTDQVEGMPMVISFYRDLTGE